MSAPKWTPGPWGCDVSRKDDCAFLVYDGAYFIAKVCAKPTIEQAAANACLIAAAPDLAEALEDVLADITTDAEQWAEGTNVYRARAALAKAKGKA